MDLEYVKFLCCGHLSGLDPGPLLSGYVVSFADEAAALQMTLKLSALFPGNS